MIHAHSPQAKGRVERLFCTYQNRLIKERRLAGADTLDASNQFLTTYSPDLQPAVCGPARTGRRSASATSDTP